MSQLSHEPESFAEQIAEMLRRIQPTAAVEMLGPREIAVNGHRFDLENLFRMVRQDPERGEEIAEHYLEQMFASEAVHMTDVPLALARPRIMPRIQPESIFEQLNSELVAHVPYVNGTVIVFVTDLPQMTVSITTEQVVKWGLTPEDLETIARENLEEYVPELEVRLVESQEGGLAAVIAEQDGYDAARLLLHDLHQRLAAQLGGNFYVATPARDMFVAFSAEPEEFVGRLHERVEHDYDRLPYPITSDLFLVTQDGVAGTRSVAA